MLKLGIYVTDARGDEHRVCWYAGTSDAAIADAIRMQLRLPALCRFLLCDSDGDLVPAANVLPPEQCYTLVLADSIPSAAAATLAAHGDAHEVSASVTPSSFESSEDAHATASGHGIVTIPMDGSSSGSNAASASMLMEIPRRMSDDMGAPSRPKKPRLHAPPEPTAEASLLDQLGLATGSPSSVMAASAQAAVLASSFSSTDPSPTSDPQLSVATHAPPTRTRSIAQIVTQFLDVFTRPIDNDDNVNFIPNTGKYALYALYCALVPEEKYHPKGHDAFYKMTSMQGKVDRQRVIRYYQDLNGSPAFVQFKPQGKGPLLRRYVVAEDAKVVQELLQAAAFVTSLELVPQVVVANYMVFVKGFRPISKADFQNGQQNGGSLMDDGS